MCGMVVQCTLCLTRSAGIWSALLHSSSSSSSSSSIPTQELEDYNQVVQPALTSTIRPIPIGWANAVRAACGLRCDVFSTQVASILADGVLHLNCLPANCTRRVHGRVFNRGVQHIHDQATEQASSAGTDSLQSQQGPKWVQHP